MVLDRPGGEGCRRRLSERRIYSKGAIEFAFVRWRCGPNALQETNDDGDAGKAASTDFTFALARDTFSSLPLLIR